MGFADDDDPFAQIERSLAKRERRLHAPRTVAGKTGAIVRCELAGALDHTGVLVGDGESTDVETLDVAGVTVGAIGIEKTRLPVPACSINPSSVSRMVPNRSAPMLYTAEPGRAPAAMQAAARSSAWTN